MTIDNNTGKNKEFYDLGKKMFDRIKPLNERSQTKLSSKRPVEADYTSQVAYTRALERYCDSLAQPAQEALYGMNQDDWKDVVAAITKVRDGRGIYLACRPTDVFQDWFLALGTAKVKEKNT